MKILLILFVLPVSLLAQLSESDSLKRLVDKTVNDSVKVDLLVKVSLSLYNSDPAESNRYALQAIILADKINYMSGKAQALKFAGLSNYKQGKFLDALDYFNQSIEIFRQSSDIAGEANILSNIGAMYSDQGVEDKALENLLQALKLSEKANDTLRIATALINIGSIYMKKPITYDRALENFYHAFDLSKRIDYRPGYGTALINIGETYYDKKQYDSALHYFDRSIKEAGDDDETICYSLNMMGKIYLLNGQFAKAQELQQRSYTIASKSGRKLEMTKALIGLGNTYLGKGAPEESIKMYASAKELASELNLNYDLKEIYEGFAKAYSNKSDFKNAFIYQNLLNDIKDTIYNIQTDRKLSNLQLDFEIEKKEGQIELLTKDKALQDVELKRQRIAKNSAIVGLALLVIIAFILYRNYKMKIKTNKILDKQKDEIEALLLNILPAEVAHELQATGNATPKFYEQVSVLFTDFKSFSQLADNMSPQQVVEELNLYFTAFDVIIEKYNLEKIKTIGDAYMCAGGIPVEDENHLTNIVRAGLEIQKYIEVMNEKRLKEGSPAWDLRIGIHTGPLVAGVVGKKKYAYDIWGSTVNIAARMESNGEPGQINISAATYELVKNQFFCTYRGKVSAKNIGQIDMYFVNYEFGKRPLNNESSIINKENKLISN